MTRQKRRRRKHRPNRPSPNPRHPPPPPPEPPSPHRHPPCRSPFPPSRSCHPRWHAPTWKPPWKPYGREPPSRTRWPSSTASTRPSVHPFPNSLMEPEPKKVEVELPADLAKRFADATT